MTARRRGFAHLHVHTVHSTLDAMIQHEEMCDEVLADAEASGSEIAAIASTDHGTLSGLYKFSKMARRRGVTPLFGNEVYLANGLQEGARFAKDGLVVAADGAELDGDKADGGTGKRKTKRYEHMTLLAETEEGWRNLIRINNAAQAPDAKWGKPRADIDLLCRHSEGIIALTGCLGGPVLGSVARGDVDRARSVLNHMLNNGFDRDHVFLEIMEHGIPQEAKAMRTMLDLGDEFEIAPVATNDAHFAAEGDAHSHEAWLCNATKSKLADPDRWKFHGEGYWLRSASDMRAIFDGDERTQMACDNTLHIAERIAQSGDIMTPSELRLPEFPVPDGYAPSASAQRKGLTGSAAYLNDQIREGAVRRYGSPLPAEVRERLTYEFDVIHSMGLGDYFLIVQDLIAAARREGIRVGPGRGCLDGDSLIWTTDGYKKIRDIAIGDLVRTHTGAIRPVEMTFRYDVDEPLYTIRSYADGQGVSMTGDHKVLVRRCSTETDVRRLRSGATFDQGLGTGPEWVRSDSVSPGDLMCIPRPPSPGTGATVIDVAALLPQDTRGTLVTVTDDEIIEVVPSNKAFRGSIRDVSMRHGIARNVIKTALGPFREPKHAARRPGLLAKYEATVARLSAALASDGWNSTEEWDEYRQSRDRITVVTPRFIPADDNLLFLIGAFASNGWLRSDSIRSVGFAEQRSQSDDTIPLAVKRVWGIEATSHPHASTDLVQWDVRSLAVRALFRKLMPDYGMKAQTKHLPSFVDDLSIDQKRSLLDGLWWGDGSRSEHRWSYSTTSPELMRQVRDLLWAIGAPAGVTVDDRTDTRKGFENRTRAWKIRTTPGFAPHAAQFGGTDDNYVYSRVREVTGSLPVAEVFDFQVGTDHSFMTDSYVVHNSAAGCAISYCLDIVNIDPIRYNLLFERFLNPERIGMPDIDIDFESSGRDWAFGYLARRYGVDRVARIGSFGVALSKGAIRAAARVLSVPGVGDDLSAAVPTNKNGKPQTFAEFMDPQNPSGDEFRRRVAQSEDHQAVAELAESWEGGIDKEGVHACGVIIGRDPLDGEVPLRESKGFWVSQWDGKDLDALQFLKLDALALRNLDVVTAAERLIEQTTGERIDADNPSLDPADPDPVVAERVRKTFELLQAGNTAGVFQLECVAGDTLVSGRKISEWFAKQEAGDPLRRTRSAYLNEGKWHFNDVIRIVKTGRSATRRLVTVTGRMIEATDGHMFMTENGWKRLDQIAVGENLLVDTRAKQLIHRTCIDCGARTNPDANNPSERCYSCSARHHSNPSSAAARSAISHAAKAGYEAGREPWNKGLDKEGSPILAENGRKIALANRGKTWEDIYGPTRAAEFRRETSVRMSGENNHMFGTTPPHTKQGYREDLGHFVRSTWEADYARVLVHFNEPYEYEKRRFDVVLPDGTRTTYTPDFYLPNRNQYVEIKGFMRDKDRVKIAAFLEQYPDIDFVLVDQVAFAEFEAANRHLVAWECPSVPKSACWEPVSQVLDAGEQDTYDIQMKAPAHNYLANGFVVHNSGGITELCVQVGPTTLDDIAAIVALYRPGPLEAKMEERYALRKNGLETVDYGIFTNDPAEQAEIAKVLDETYGTCLAGDTRVYSLSRGHLVDLRDVKVGELVQSVDPDSFEATAGEVLNFASMGERDTFSLRLRSGDRIEATADHLVLTTDGWKCVADLREGDLVGRPSGAMEPESIDDDPTPELAAVLGYLLGDGGLSVGSSVIFSNKDESVLAAYRQAVQAVFPDVVHSERTGDRAVRHLRAGSGSGGGGRANSLTEWLRSVGLKAPAEQWRDGGPTSADKFVPLEFLRARPEVVVRLLAALWDCDGHVSAPGTRYATTYKTISKQLAEDVRFLLLRLGVASHIGTHDYSPGVTAYQVNVCGTGFDEIVGRHLASAEKAHRSAGREQVCPGHASMLPTLMVLDAVRRKGSVRSFYEQRGWTRPHVRHTTISSGRAAQTNSELHDPILTKYLRLHWSQVVSIEPAGRQEVFDIEVAEAQNFVANGMVVHNCIFQEQLMRLGDVVAGFGPIERNRLQKAVSKKLQDEMAAVGELFIAGAMAERRNDDGTLAKMAFRRDTAEKVWAAIKGAGNYAFNASHSYAYARVTYITAFVKANWPTQYGAALLSVTKKADKRHEMLLSLAAEGITVVAPRINEALVETTVNDAGEVVIGMVEVRDVSHDDAEAIVAARDAGGPFTSLSDFARRRLATGLATRVKIGAFEGLIEAGAFDELAPEGRTNRMGMVLIARALGQLPDLVPFDCEWSHLERARREAHRLGVLISPNPTKYLGPQIREASIGGIKASPLRKADEQRAGGEFTTAAIVSSWSEQSGHWGRRADVLLTGTGAAVRATIWDKTLHKLRAAGRIPEVGDLVLVKGKIVMRKARLENENGEMADGEAVADEKAEISVWEMQVVDVDGKHFDVPAGPPALHEHWFVRPDGFIDEPEPAPLAVEAPAAGELPFGDPDPVVTTEPVSEPQADPEPSVLAAAPDVATRPADRSVAAPASPFGELLEADPGVVELPWSEGEVDTIIVELAHGSLGASSSTSSALRIMRREVAAVVSAVVHLQRRPHSDGADIADEVRPLVDEMLAGRPVEVVAYDEPQPRSTWLVPADGEWGVAAQAWAEHLASPAPVVALAAPVADRTAA